MLLAWLLWLGGASDGFSMIRIPRGSCLCAQPWSSGGKMHTFSQLLTCSYPFYISLLCLFALGGAQFCDLMAVLAAPRVFVVNWAYLPPFAPGVSKEHTVQKTTLVEEDIIVSVSIYANDQPDWPTFCKWSSGWASLLQMIIWMGRHFSKVQQCSIVSNSVQ